MIDSCVGADPGPTAGLAFLDYENGKLVGRSVLQCDGGSAPIVLKGHLLAYYSGNGALWPAGSVPAIGRRTGSVEKFVTGQSAGSRGKAAEVTRQLVMELAEVLELFGYTVTIRPAADVKPWASDRLVKAALNLPALTDDLRHGWDAARHCLYGAHEAGVIAHPLLRRTAKLPDTPSLVLERLIA